MQWHDNGQGYLRRNLAGEAAYYSFAPTPLESVVPLELSDETARLISACSHRIGTLKGMMAFVPNAARYLTMYVRKEALLSAQIEGTQCTFDDILNPGNTELTQREIADVINYVKAIGYALNRMNELPLCIRLLKETHAILLESSRGSEKNPGETRRSQNWIGPAGSSLSTASYVPPNVADMTEALSELERFIHSETPIDPLIRAALTHYQFETIHPFLDGNGRLGRMLITLMLVNDGLLSSALFYPSYHLKLRRAEYYERLTDVRERGTYGLWVHFFVECMLEAADDAIRTLGSLVELHRTHSELISFNLGGASANGQRLLTLLEENPIIEAPFVAERLEVSRTTAGKLIDSLTRLGILVQKDGKKRYRTFLYESYLELLRRGGEPL